MQSGFQHEWDGTARELGVMWELHHGKHTARCVIVSHPLGWELRLLVKDDLLRSDFYREQYVAECRDEWKSAMLASGWA